ncbi:MAG TPA: alpha/beta hydrolase [Jiangellaceae bacterium]|nr:alpha/beta hydrolase [Jiangellaceae bacterium]
MNLAGVGALAGALVIVAGACTGSPDAAFQPSLEWTDCPAKVESTFLSDHECGYLTVLEDRSKQDGPTVKLLVIRVPPVGATPAPGIVSGIGQNVGDPYDMSGGIATGATRLGRVVIELEHRGAGPYSEPSLRCPEVDALTERAAISLTGDDELTALFVDAVGACAQRLRSSGIEPAAYDVASVVADREDLRTVLGIDQWYMLGSYGTASRYLFEYLRTHPDRVGAAYADSPWFPELDELTGGALGTRAALKRLFEACESDPECSASYPNLEQTWTAALERLAKAPLDGTYETADGDTIDVTVDAGKLLRVARFTLGGDGPGNLRSLPEMIAAAADGQITPQVLSIVANDPVFCAGYRPLCSGQDGFSLGVYLTTFCRDQLPFIDHDALSAAIDNDPSYQAVFGDSPYVRACDAWDVPPSDAPNIAPVDTDVPLLFLPGQFDSYSPPEWAQEQAARQSRAWSIEIPANTHNTLGFAECAISARNAWVGNPTTPPDTTACNSAPPIEFETPP